MTRIEFRSTDPTKSRFFEGKREFLEGILNFLTVIQEYKIGGLTQGLAVDNLTGASIVEQIQAAILDCGPNPCEVYIQILALLRGLTPLSQFQSCSPVDSVLVPSTHARDFPNHTAAVRTSTDGRAVEIAVRVKHRSIPRTIAVTTAEVVEIDHGAHLGAIRQLEYPADLMGAASRTHPKKITGGVQGYATVGFAV